MKLTHAVLLLLLASPAAAQAAGPALVSRDVPLRPGERTLSSASVPRFNMVGLHWQGGGTVSFRTRSPSGTWSPWRPAAPEDEDRPDPGTAERTTPGWRIGNPYWTGTSDAIQVRRHGSVRRVRAHYVWSPVTTVPHRSITLAPAPPIIPRLSWGANESIRRDAPKIASTLQLAIVHHTAGTNSYTAAQSAAIVRGIMVYHVQGNGWDDIGYNFLVDKYGQVFEGRWGGIERNVVGAHAEGFNTGSVGVAVLGNYTGVGITQAARNALSQLVAWRLDVAHVDPLTTLTFVSGGTARFPKGVPVFLRTISAHRDTGFTSCPGNLLYAALNAIAGQIGATGLPKLYAPTVSGAVGGPVRFRARLSAPLPWTVTVTDAGGNRIASGAGSTESVDWTWDATSAPPGAYAWTIEAGLDVLPARGTIGGPAATLTLTRARAEPVTVSPNGDGLDDQATIAFTLGAPATVTATLHDAAGAALATLLSESRPAGDQSFRFNADAFADGGYTIAITARNGAGRQATARVAVVVNRTLGYLGASRPVFSPNGDGRLDTASFTFLLGASAAVKLRILREGKWLATAFDGPLEPGTHTLSWDGKKRRGGLRDGTYEAEVSATTGIGTVAYRLPVSVDTRPPAVALLGLRPLRIRVDEPGQVFVWVNGQRKVYERKRPGILWLRPPRVLRTVKIVARDAAGNSARPLVRRL